MTKYEQLNEKHEQMIKQVESIINNIVADMEADYAGYAIPTTVRVPRAVAKDIKDTLKAFNETRRRYYRMHHNINA